MKSPTCDKNVGAKDVSNKEKEWFQILAIVIASISGLTNGTLFAWTSPFIPMIVADKANYNISLEEASYFTVLPPLGSIVSCFLSAKLADTLGRKYTLLLIAVPHITAYALIATAKSVYVFYAARFITGFGDSCLFSTLPMYIGEVATPKVRGTWGNTLTFSLYAGQLIINVIGSYTSVVAAACICLSFPLIFFFAFLFMPETPYFYLMKNRTEDARKSLQKLRRQQNVDEELARLQADVNRQMSESGTWKDVFIIKSNRKALYAGIFLRASQHLGGISSFAVYTQYIFLESGGDISPSISAIIFCVLCTSLNLVASRTLDKFGRQRSYFYSMLLCAIVLLFVAIYFYIKQSFTYIDVSSVNWIPLAAIILYVFFYSFGIGIVPTLMLGELFSTSIKAKGLLVLNICFAISISISTKIFNLLDTNFGLYSPFLFFALCCFISTVLTPHFVPETKGKTLEQIQQCLKGHKSEESQ